MGKECILKIHILQVCINLSHLGPSRNHIAVNTTSGVPRVCLYKGTQEILYSIHTIYWHET